MKKVSSYEWIIISITVCLIVVLITPPFTFLILSWCLVACSLGMMMLTNTSFLKLKRVIFIITLLWACSLTGSTEFNPLSVRIQGGQFDNVPVAEILQYFAKQRDGHSRWSFVLIGDKLPTQKVSLLIPDDTSFQEVLDTISQATECNYKWYRYRFCGNDPGTGSIRFELSQANENAEHRLYIYSFKMVRVQK